MSDCLVVSLVKHINDLTRFFFIIPNYSIHRTHNQEIGIGCEDIPVKAWVCDVKLAA